MLQLKSYGGYLTYDIQYRGDGGSVSPARSVPDVVLIGSDGREAIQSKFIWLEFRLEKTD